MRTGWLLESAYVEGVDVVRRLVRGGGRDVEMIANPDHWRFPILPRSGSNVRSIRPRPLSLPLSFTLGDTSHHLSAAVAGQCRFLLGGTTILEHQSSPWAAGEDCST